MSDRVDVGAYLVAPAAEINDYIKLNSAPSPSLSGVAIYSNGEFSIKNTNVATIALAALTADRVYSLPDYAGTFSLIAGTETLLNKTIIGATNTVHANALKTTGAPVVVDTAAPPTTGQVLTATSATTAAWMAGGSGSGRIAYTILPFLAIATSTDWITVSYWTWSQTRYSGYTAGVFIITVTITGALANIRLRDTTNSVTIASASSISSSGVLTLSVTNPTTDALVELQVQKTTNTTPNPTFVGATLEFST
jgi:hypothetical protein